MSDLDKARENYDAYLYCRQHGHDEFLANCEESIRFMANDQWPAEDVRRLRAQGRPYLVINEYRKAIESVLGDMLDNPIDIRYAPVYGDEETAALHDKLYMAIARANKLDNTDRKVLRNGILLGRGYYDVRTDFNDNIQGEVKVCSRRPQNVLLFPDIDDDDPDTWPEVTTIDRMSHNKIHLRWGKEVADEVRSSHAHEWIDPHERFVSSSARNRYPAYDSMLDAVGDNVLDFPIISRQFREVARKEVLVDPETGDFYEIPENWRRDQISRVIELTGAVPMKRRVMTIRWRMSAGGVLLHDEPSVYKHFTIVPFMPYFIDGLTPSLADALKDPQILLNKTVSKEVEILNTSSNSGWKLKTGSLKNMQPEELEERGAENGLVLELDDVSNAEKITPNTPPSGHDMMSRKAVEYIRALSGASDAMLNTARADMPAKTYLATLANGTSGGVLATMAMFNTKRMVGERILDNVQAYYTETRTFQIVRDKLTGETEAVTINQPDEQGGLLNDVTRGKYAVVAVPTRSRLTAQESEFEQLVQLRAELGINIPDHVLVAASAVQNKAELVQTLRELNGGAPQSPEAQRMAELEMRLRELEAAQAEADLQKTNADTQLALGRAQRAMAESQFDGRRATAELNMFRAQSDAELRRQQIEQQERKNDTDTALKLTELTVKQRAEQQRSATPKPAATQRNRNGKESRTKQRQRRA